MAESVLVMLAGVLGLLLVGMILVGAVLIEFWRRDKLERFGLTSKAKIVARKDVPLRSINEYFVTYRFTFPDKAGYEISATEEQQVSERNYKLLTEGREVTVKFLKRDPRKSVRLTGRFTDNTDCKHMLILGAGAIVLSMIGLAVALRQ